MKSPFAGMDPFIEACGLWEDFHAKLIAGLEETLARALPERYCVRIGERFYVVVAVAGDEERKPAVTDVGITVPRGEWAPGNAPQPVAVAEPANGPVTMRPFIEQSFRETFLEIQEIHTRKLVTVIEVLSPTNKRPDTEGWRLYLRKRQACLRADDLNFVEIDLLRGGQRMPMLDPWPASPYYYLVHRQGPSQACQVWPALSLTPLPALGVPLRPRDADAPVAMQALVEAIYERSRYHADIDYRASARLDPAEAACLDQCLRDRSAKQ